MTTRQREPRTVFWRVMQLRRPLLERSLLLFIHESGRGKPVELTIAEIVDGFGGTLREGAMQRALAALRKDGLLATWPVPRPPV